MWAFIAGLLLGVFIATGGPEVLIMKLKGLFHRKKKDALRQSDKFID